MASREALDHLVAVAEHRRRARPELDVTFFTGHMSGPNWAPGWLLDREGATAARRLRVISGERCGQRLSQPVRRSGRRSRPSGSCCGRWSARCAQHPAIWLWNLGNEPDLFACRRSPPPGERGWRDDAADPRVDASTRSRCGTARRRPERDNGLRVDGGLRDLRLRGDARLPDVWLAGALAARPRLCAVRLRADRGAVAASRC